MKTDSFVWQLLTEKSNYTFVKRTSIASLIKLSVVREDMRELRREIRANFSCSFKQIENKILIRNLRQFKILFIFKCIFETFYRKFYRNSI